jgi:MGT family glycosyltransferase
MSGRHVLFASIPAWGHVYPVLEGAAELVRRGHRVSFLASPGFVREVQAVADPVKYDSPADSSDPRLVSQDMVEVMSLMLEEARASFAAIERRVREDRPDLIIYDVMAWAGWAAGQAFDIPAICTWPVFASNEHFSLHSEYVSLDAESNAMYAFFGEVAGFLADIGLTSVSPQEFFESAAQRNIVLFPRELQPRGDTFGSRFTFVPPCIRPAERSPELHWLRRSQPLAAISLGTIYNQRPDFFRTCIEGVERLGWHAAVSLGSKVRPEDVGPVSDRVILRPRLPMIDTLRHASVLISQGGMSSTMEALAHGVPLLLAPQMGEQRAIADRVADLGLGVRLPDQFTAAELAELAGTAVNDADMAKRLREFREGMRSDHQGKEFGDAVEQAFTG